MRPTSRRDFLKYSTRTIAALSSAATFSHTARGEHAKRDTANDKIVFGVIGLGGRGRDLSAGFARLDDAEVAYLCDVDLDRVGDFPDTIAREQGGRTPKVVQDMRRIYDDPDVDAVVIATCDHWHALAAVWACQAGKDVYVEKPPSHNIWEGRKMVEAARKYNRVVQAGTQNRSAPYIHEAAEYIRSGRLGEAPLVKVYNLKPGGPFRVPEDSPQPEGLDYDMYLGPAPSRPFNEAHFHSGWKKFWAYSGGDLADDGIHQLDIARLLVGDPAYPKAVNCSGGKLAFNDEREVPDTQVLSFEYENAVVTFELTQYTPYMQKTPDRIRMSDEFPAWRLNATRIEVYGSRGLMYVGRHGGGWQVVTSDERVKEQAPGRMENERHRRNFLECVRSREKPNADIEIGHLSAVMVHLGNIGVRLGGRRLVIDPQSERIVGDAEADALVKRVYRDPYVVPETV
ncbi:MAG TPA: Gfo/Idh/MocA family oxidoreductase [Candidatus Hydrogenedentes bacterium]|nr:Gfo/Idh/MocA family oxidoreductase [Candidatus Hydrogenedentota bacterium]